MLTGRGGQTPPTRLRIEFMARTAALIVVIGATLAAGPVAAQFGNPFNDLPPRPPADVPKLGSRRRNRRPSNIRPSSNIRRSSRIRRRSNIRRSNTRHSGKLHPHRHPWRADPRISKRNRWHRLPAHRQSPPMPIAVARPPLRHHRALRHRRRRPVLQRHNRRIRHRQPHRPGKRTIRPSSRRRPKRSSMAALCLPASTRSRAVPSSSTQRIGETVQFGRVSGDGSGLLHVVARSSPPIPTPSSKSTK